MQPLSLLFILFVGVLLGIYYLVGRTSARDRQWVALLVGSLAYYLWCGWQNIVFLLFTSFSTWFVALRLATLERQCKEACSALSRKERKPVRQAFQRRKWLELLAALVLNFGVLGYLKYWNVLLDYVGLGSSFLASHLLLPLGISFYTFTSLGYLIDVYNGKVEPEPSYPLYLLFVSWFPQLVQGPINRWAEMRGQLLPPHDWDLERTRRALLLVGYGMLKKFVMADTLASLISTCLDKIDFSTPGIAIIVGIVCYSLQQYGDFSGGIDIVEGVSELFGVHMAPNFRQPYFATSLADFWRRWHMSLGEWMRTYVFYPLAMRPSMMNLNKWGTQHLGKTIGRTLSACIANVVVFVLVGLWHGAEAHYLLWGLYNGLVIAFSDMCRPLFERGKASLHIREDSAAWRRWSIVRTFILVNIGRYFDRINDPGTIALAFKNTFTNLQPMSLVSWVTVINRTNHNKLGPICAAIACIIVLMVDIRRERGEDVSGQFLALPLLTRVATYGILGAIIMLSLSIATTGGGFLYANF